MSDLLLLTLEVAVPLRIAEFRAQGGPTEADLASARAFGIELASRGDVLLFGGKKGEAAEMFNRAARALAVLAYCPGGVRFAGAHWAAEELLAARDLHGRFAVFNFPDVPCRNC
jgi:hypothetical protein